MKQINELEVGDEVLVVPVYLRGATGTPGVVVKVARVWMTVQLGRYRTEKFRRDNGFGEGDPAGWRITTPEMIADARARELIGARLREFGIDTYRLSHKVSTEAMADVVALIEADVAVWEATNG